jgi:beta-N-acetylhexosaminidase
LKGTLGFRGVVITDDLEMYGARQDGASIPETCYRALMAGNDMILVSRSPLTQEKTWKTLSLHMRRNTMFRERVKDSVRRILSLKLRFIKKNAIAPDYTDPVSVIDAISRIQERESKDFVFQNACRSVTTIRSGRVPYTKTANEKMLLVGQYRSFIECGLLRFPDADTYEYSCFPQAYSLERERKKIGRLSAEHDTIIFCLANKNSLEILETLKHLGKQIIVISALTPVYISEVRWVDTAIAVYGTCEESFQAGFAVLCGDFPAPGGIPIAVK